MVDATVDTSTIANLNACQLRYADISCGKPTASMKSLENRQ